MCPEVRTGTPAAGDPCNRSQLRAKPGDPATLAGTGGAAGGGDLLSWEVWGAAAGGSAGAIPELGGAGLLLTCSSVPQPGNQTCLE